MTNQLSNYGDVQTRTHPARCGLARRSIRNYPVRWVCFGTKRSGVVLTCCERATTYGQARSLAGIAGPFATTAPGCIPSSSAVLPSWSCQRGNRRYSRRLARDAYLAGAAERGGSGRWLWLRVSPASGVCPCLGGLWGRHRYVLRMHWFLLFVVLA
jgi:hypothetical protein